jgi:hypothetical protein
MSNDPCEDDSAYSAEQFAEAIEAMRDAGRKAGRRAGGWVADGNTSERSLRAILILIDDGEFDVPAPFSGEWADDPTPREVIQSETELDPDFLEPEETDELLYAFEDEFSAAYLAEAERIVRGLLPEE